MTGLYGFSLQHALLRGRTLGLAALPLLVAVVVVVVGVATSVPARYGVTGTVVGTLLTGLVVPVVALVLGSGAFGEERESRTLGTLRSLARPRWQVVVARWAAVWTATVLVCLPAALACALLSASVRVPVGEAFGGVAAAVLLTSAAYTAVFVLLSLLTRRGLLAGLAYLVLWETFLAGLAPALRGASIASYGRRVASLAVPDDLVVAVSATSSVATSALVLAGVAVVAVSLGAWRWRRLDVA